jgi:hypothetical protein
LYNFHVIAAFGRDHSGPESPGTTRRDFIIVAALIPLGLLYLAMLGPKKRTARILDELREKRHAAETALATSLRPDTGGAGTSAGSIVLPIQHK